MTKDVSDMRINNINKKIEICLKIIQEIQTEVEMIDMSINLRESNNKKMLLSWKETQELLGIGYTSLKHNVDMGKLRPVDLSENRRPFKLKDIENFVDSLEYIK